MLEGERALGATFAPDEIGWVDFESRGRTSIKDGAYRYAIEADAVVLAYAIGDTTPRTVAVRDFGAPLDWADIPDDLKKFFERVERRQAVFAAWNCGFDRAVWNFSTTNFPEMRPNYIIDAMTQATTAGLPPDLASAAEESGSVRKQESGKDLIKLFCLPESEGTPQSHPAEWRQFSEIYAPGDIWSMRSVFKATRQLSRAEWEESWAMEKINERGVMIDMDLVSHAAKLAEEDKRRSRLELSALTDGVVTTVDQVKRMIGWLDAKLPTAGREILIKRIEERDEETGELIRPAKHSLNRRKVEKLLALMSDIVADDDIPILQRDQYRSAIRLLQIRLYGGSKTPAKFSKMLSQQIDGVLYGQYVPSGAAQTGRASSKGVQIHNLMRDKLDYEPDALDALAGGISYDDLAVLGNSDPVARKLSLLIRPAFVPKGERIYAWSDLSQIEARVCPWLADYDPGARERLKIFTEVDNDPKVPDIYTRTAAVLSGIPIKEVTKPIRQRGKVAELSLGFGGSVGALQNMGLNYGLFVNDADARIMVDTWRANNQWAVKFWDRLKEAVDSALGNPGLVFPAGRVAYIYLDNYLGGSLLCMLPSGRFLTYRAIRYEKVADVDDDDNVVGYSTHLRFSRGYGRIKLWHGMLCENAVQAVAADILRGTIRRLEDECADWMPLRLHTHDEVLAEIEKDRADETEAKLREVMRRGFDWSDNLPIMSEETAAYYYTKHEESYGL